MHNAVEEHSHMDLQITDLQYEKWGNRYLVLMKKKTPYLDKELEGE